MTAKKRLFIFLFVRITSGKLKGQKLFYPRFGLRPTKEITRQAIFNLLGEDIVGARVLDLFAGGGSLGIEAFSRGATTVVFIEMNREAVRCLKENLINCQGAEIIKGDVFRVIPKLTKREFDIVLADPPYGQRLVQKTVDLVIKYNLVQPGGLLVLEHNGREKPVCPEGWETFKQRKYGESMITIFRRQK